MSPSSIRYQIGEKPFCSESGDVGRINRFFATVHESEWEKEIVNLTQTHTVLQSAYLTKGGFPNVESEQVFSLCRVLGLKFPNRPVKLGPVNVKSLGFHEFG